MSFSPLHLNKILGFRNFSLHFTRHVLEMCFLSSTEKIFKLFFLGWLNVDLVFALIGSMGVPPSVMEPDQDPTGSEIIY